MFTVPQTKILRNFKRIRMFFGCTFPSMAFLLNYKAQFGIHPGFH